MKSTLFLLLICSLTLSAKNSYYSTYKTDSTVPKHQHYNQELTTLQKLFQKSKKDWPELKKEHQNSYQYTLSQNSWTGFGRSITVTIENGTPVKRVTRKWTPIRKQGNLTAKIEEIIEGVDELKKSNDQPKTMDQFYTLCETDFLKHNPETHALALSLSPENVLTGCSYRLEQCADDCTQGLPGLKFKWIKPGKKMHRYTTSNRFKGNIPDFSQNQSISTLKKELQKSKKMWQQFQKEHQNSYQTTRFHQSKEAHGGYQTTVSVDNGIIKERTYVSWRGIQNQTRPGTYNSKTIEYYRENEKMINRNKKGFPAKTVDALYQQCLSETLTKSPKKYRIDLVITPDGLIGECSYWQYGCKGDCKKGIYNLKINPIF